MYKLRMAQDEDAQRVLEIYAPYVTDSSITFEYEVPLLEEFRGRMGAIMAQYPFVVCEEGAGMLGYAYAHRAQERAAYGWNAELSIYLARDARGKGIGRRLYEAIIEILRLQNVQNLYALITHPNQRSERFHEKMGFTCSGCYSKTGYKTGSWHDVRLYERSIGGHASPPKPFISISEVPGEQILKLLEA